MFRRNPYKLNLLSDSKLTTTPVAFSGNENISKIKCDKIVRALLPINESPNLVKFAISLGISMEHPLVIEAVKENNPIKGVIECWLMTHPNMAPKEAIDILLERLSKFKLGHLISELIKSFYSSSITSQAVKTANTVTKNSLSPNRGDGKNTAPSFTSIASTEMGCKCCLDILQKPDHDCPNCRNPIKRAAQIFLSHHRN